MNQELLLGGESSTAAWLYVACLTVAVGSTLAWGATNLGPLVNALFGAGEKKKFAHADSPWGMADKFNGAGWCYSTAIKKSSIPEAGNARYTLENISKGAVVRRTQLVRSQDAKGEIIRTGTTMVSTCVEDLEVLQNYDDTGAAISTTDQIVNFGATPYNVSQDNNVVYHWTPSNYFNHKTTGANVILQLSPVDPTHARVVALRDIKAGEELIQDYRSFNLPKWYTEWCVSATKGEKMDCASLGHMVTPNDIPFLRPASSERR